MNDEYEKFMDWAKLNNIELYPYQEIFIKAFFQGRLINIPRQNNKSYGMDMLSDYYNGLEENQK